MQAKARKLSEGKAVFFASAGKISKGLPIFYNPVMKLNRDVAVLLLNSVKKEGFHIADITAGSGIRSIRFVKELKAGKVKSVCANDSGKDAVSAIKKNIKLNKAKRIKVFNLDANEFLLQSNGFDYIDVDPFGSPNAFLNSAVVRLARNGILAVTATDTSALSGTYEMACRRKYWGVPLRNELMHEMGARILIRKVQLIGAQFDKALIPVFTHASDHYIRVYFLCKKSKSIVDQILKKHLFLLYCTNCLNFFVSHHNLGECCGKKMIWSGPLWSGRLWDSILVSRMYKNADKSNPALAALLSLVKNESKIDSVGFFDIHRFAQKYKFAIPKKKQLLEQIKKKGFKAAVAHFDLNGFRTNIPLKKFVSLLK